MSIDYQIFLHCRGGIAQRLSLLSSIEGVSVVNPQEVRIDGLVGVNCHKLDDRHRRIMQDDYGDYGLDLNWVITGTRDDDADPNDLIDRLIRCAAAFVNAFPDESCSVMSNGETFYLYNTRDRLIVGPVYAKALAEIPPIFQKPAEIAAAEQRELWGW